MHIAIIGRPNVGKSSLVNAMVGSERVLVDAAPGTTRDAVDTPLLYQGHPYVLVDTAGIRRKGRVTEVLEKLAVIMARKSLERCQVALVVLDASEGIAAQDAHLAGYADDAGRATVLVVNKWDLVPPGMVRKAEVIEQIRDRLPFLDYAPVCFTSAVRGEGVSELFETIARVAVEARRRPSGGAILETLRQAIERRPISVAGAPLTLQSVVQIAVGPPTFALRVSRPVRDSLFLRAVPREVAAARVRLHGFAHPSRLPAGGDAQGAASAGERLSSASASAFSSR